MSLQGIAREHLLAAKVDDPGDAGTQAPYALVVRPLS